MSRRIVEACVARLLATVLALCALCPVADVWSAPDKQAQAQAARDREQLRKLQQANQKLTSEKAQVEQEKAQLEAAKDSLSGEMRALSGKLRGVEGRARSTQERLARAEKDNTDLKEKVSAIERQLSETASILKATEEDLRGRVSDIKRLEAQSVELRRVVGRQGELVKSCEERNGVLYQINAELIERYRSKGVADALLGAEPFTGVKKVEQNAVVQEYRDKIDEQRILPRKVAQP